LEQIKVMALETTRTIQNFKDILADRYGTSDFMWMSRDWKPVLAYPHLNNTNPQKIKVDVLNSPRVEHIIEELSKEQNMSKERLYKTVKEILDEIGYNRQLSVVRWLGVLLLKILKKTCNGLYINEASVHRNVLSVNKSMGNNPVVFAPSHRSYADFVLMSYLCYHYKIEIPTIAAGMDFHSMWLMGHFLRESCAFFMRRSFATEIHLILDKILASVSMNEDSRSAKSLSPKVGLLSMILVPFFTGRVPDITIVPINISYDRTLEEVLFAYELLGVPKPKETTSGFLKALNMLNEKYGRVHINFGEPISVKDMCMSNGLQRRLPTPESTQVHGTLTPNEVSFSINVAHCVVQQQQRHSVLSAFNLIAIILNNSLFEGTGPPLFSDVVANVSWFKSVMEELGALLDIKGEPGSVDTAVKEAIAIHKSLVILTPTNHLKLIKVHNSHRVIDPAKLKGHSLSHQTMDVAVPMVMLQHYVNPCLHYLIGPAMVTLILRHLDEAVEISRDDLFKKFNFVRALFTFEFSFYGPWAEKEFADSLKQLEALSVIDYTKSGGLKLGNHKKLQILLSNLLKPFLQGYLCICQVLKQTTSSPWSESNLLKATQKKTLQSLSHMDVITRIRKNGKVEYEPNAVRLSEVIKELENLMLPSEEIFHLSDISSKHFVTHETQQAKL
ncbi:hypothetical protein L9F63_017967, partial [Diploptera punctata]